MSLLHAACVAWDGRAVLISGASGSGKSQLAISLIGLGAVLVADDQVHLSQEGATLMASAPERLRGMVEARGLGLLRLRSVDAAPVILAVDLDQSATTRLPTPMVTEFNSVALPLIAGGNRPNLAYEIIALLRFGLDPLFHDPELPIP